MQKLYKKSELSFALVFIAIYVFLAGIFDSLSQEIGVAHSLTIAFFALMSAILIIFMQKNCLFEHFGLCRVKSQNPILYLPVFAFVIINFIFGVRVNFSIFETVLFIIKKAFVAFLEELIFRGFLFKAMQKTSLKTAVIVSSLTFGIGHIVNLFNGSAMTLVSNLCQIITAVLIGFVFTLCFVKTGSILPQIIAHFLINASSAFCVDHSLYQNAVVVIVVTIISAAYTVYIIKKGSR